MEKLTIYYGAKAQALRHCKTLTQAGFKAGVFDTHRTTGFERFARYRVEISNTPGVPDFENTVFKMRD